MTTKPFLIAAGASLALALGALACPDAEAHLPDLEAKAREQSERAEQKIHHLEEAARHLDAVGMEAEAARLRDQAALRRTDHRKRLAELEHLIERRAEEQRQREIEELVRAATEQLTRDLRAERDAGREKPRAAGDPDERARAEDYRRRTLQNWARIKEAARGDHAPRPDQRPSDKRAPAPSPGNVYPPRPPATGAPTDRAPLPTAPDGHAEVLQQILRTLQRIERRMQEE